MKLLSLLMPEVNARQVLALAGVTQAVSCIQSLSERGHCNADNYARNVRALLALNPKDDSEIFGSPAELAAGLNLLNALLDGESRSQNMRYMMQILYLQKKLMRHTKTVQQVTVGIEKANRQVDFYGVDSEALALSLGDLYQNTISKLGFRIQIMGSPDYLSQERIAAKVRALLFSGIRFSLLWRQFGGRSSHIILSKRSILTHSKRLLESDKLPEKNNANY